MYYVEGRSLDFITTGKLDAKYGRLISRLYELRQSGDYDDKFDATEQEIIPYFSQVEEILRVIEELIRSNTNID